MFNNRPARTAYTSAMNLHILIFDADRNAAQVTRAAVARSLTGTAGREEQVSGTGSRIGAGQDIIGERMGFGEVCGRAGIS